MNDHENIWNSPAGTSLGQLLKQKLANADEMILRYGQAAVRVDDDSYVLDRSCQKAVAFPHAERNSILKENKQMSTSLNYNALVHLADTDLSAELAKFNGASTGLKAALEKKLAEKKDQANEAAAEVVLKVLETKEQSVTSLVHQIRACRQTIKNAQAQIEKLQKATEYGHATENYLPLLKTLNLTYMINMAGVDPELLEMKELSPAAQAETV